MRTRAREDRARAKRTRASASASSETATVATNARPLPRELRDGLAGCRLQIARHVGASHDARAVAIEEKAVEEPEIV